MAIFGNSGLPDDFFARVHRHIEAGHRYGNDAVHDAVLAVLGRPLNDAERSAIVDAAQAGILTRSLYPDGVPSHVAAGTT
jgi:hypothetical protein